METSSAKPYAGKRTLDLLVAGTACAAFAPLVAGIAVAAWLEDSGSPLFAQPRVGRQRSPFTIFKLRSMREQRVTRVGRWLRRTGIDELPQFVNVLRGEMSVVGPRPLTQQDVERLGWHEPPHDWRFSVNPGITGLSQLMAAAGIALDAAAGSVVPGAPESAARLAADSADVRSEPGGQAQRAALAEGRRMR